MTIFPYVTGVGAIAADLVLFHRAFPPMLASVRPGARIDELAIVQRYFSHNSVGVHHVSRLYSLVVHPYLAHTPDQTYPKIKYISLSRCEICGRNLPVLFFPLPMMTLSPSSNVIENNLLCLFR